MSELLLLLPKSELVAIFEVLMAVLDCMTFGSVTFLRNGCYYFPMDTAQLSFFFLFFFCGRKDKNRTIKSVEIPIKFIALSVTSLV
jgi:hypothetical protein